MAIPLAKYVDTHIEKSFQRIENSLSLMRLESKNNANELNRNFEEFKKDSHRDSEELKKSISTTMMMKALSAAGFVAGGLLGLGNNLFRQI